MTAKLSNGAKFFVGDEEGPNGKSNGHHLKLPPPATNGYKTVSNGSWSPLSSSPNLMLSCYSSLQMVGHVRSPSIENFKALAKRDACTSLAHELDKLKRTSVAGSDVQQVSQRARGGKYKKVEDVFHKITPILEH